MFRLQLKSFHVEVGVARVTSTYVFRGLNHGLDSSFSFLNPPEPPHPDIVYLYDPKTMEYPIPEDVEPELF